MISRNLKLLLILSFVLFGGCRRGDEYPNRPITLVCPWSQGGGTDRCSRQIAVHLESELGVPVNVVNATGGKGVTGHSRGMSARPDGYTLLMATLELNMMHWSELTDLTFDDCIPLVSINEDYAAIMVQNDAPWKTLAELEAAIQSEPGKLQCSGTASGGAWHVGLAGWLIAKGMNVEDVVWVSHQGSAPALQDLISGGLDMVCCSLPEARTMLKSGELRSLGVMAPKRAIGFEQIPTFAEQGTDWSLGGWRAIAVPQGTPDEITGLLLKTLERIVKGETSIKRTIGDDQEVEETFPQFMAAQAFDNTWRTGDGLQKFLSETDQKFGDLLTSEAMRSVNRDPMNSMLYPIGIIVMMLVCLAFVLMSDRHQRAEAKALSPTDSSESSNAQISLRGLVGFILFVLAIVFYTVFAESLGFIVTAGIVMLTTLLFLRPKSWPISLHVAVSLLFTLGFVPLTYQLFAVGLRVPLPQGWFGW